MARLPIRNPSVRWPLRAIDDSLAGVSARSVDQQLELIERGLGCLFTGPVEGNANAAKAKLCGLG